MCYDELLQSRFALSTLRAQIFHTNKYDNFMVAMRYLYRMAANDSNMLE